jgi:hypothetical protein
MAFKEFRDAHKPHDAKLNRNVVGSTPGHGGVTWNLHDHVDKSVLPDRMSEQRLASPLKRGVYEGQVKDTGETGER